MKNVYMPIVLATGMLYTAVNAQNTFPSTGAAGIGTVSPNASSLLEVRSTTKGVLISRMTLAERNAIVAPATGLLIYQTNSAPGFYYYNGTAWSAVTAKNFWSLTGNAGTNGANNFIGTTDAQTFTIKVKNQKSGYIDYDIAKANTAFGYQSLNSNTGGYNTAYGYDALKVNTTGNNNTAGGYNALGSNSTGYNNTAFGSFTLSYNTTGINNTSLGNGALQANSKGNDNTASGYFTLYTNTTGSQNSAYGEAALNRNTTGNNNTANGFASLYLNTTGYSNIAVGGAALYSNSTRSNLVAIGDSALYNNGTGAVNSFDGAWNTALGSKALYANTIGYANTALGYNALDSNTTGAQNTGVGTGALQYNKTGSNNTAVAPYALYKNTTGGNNTAVGEQSLSSNTTGNNNAALGYFSLGFNTKGYSNVAIGVKTLYKNTIRSNLVAIGDSALYNNGAGVTGGSDGTANTAVGSKALFSNTVGFGNTATGLGGLYSNKSGRYNSGYGFAVMYFNDSGLGNAGFGSLALYYNTGGASNSAMGTNALYANTVGSYNCADGSAALASNISGSGNTGIGYSADVASDNLNNATAVGYLALVDASNKVTIGNAGVSSIGGQVGWTTFSDGRFKKNIKQDVQGLAFINSLKPITYTVDINGLNNYRDKGKKHDDTYEKAKAGMKDADERAAKIVYNGFIAQDVEKAAEKLNYHFSGVDKPQTQDGLYGLRYSDFVVPLVKAVQEISQRNDSLQNENNDLKKQFEELKALVLSIQQKQETCSPCSQLTASKQGTMSDQLSAMSGASLQQNIPNPFTNSTVINYTLPQKFTSAQILITDKTGKVLKTATVSGSGKGSLNVNASTLAAGAYQYSLVVDGRVLVTKQMVLAK